jgi:transcriptional regulator with XRE-family HTH domain
MKPLARYMEEAGLTVDELVAAAGLDAKLVKAIVSGNYTPSPSERQRLAAAIGVSIDDIAWGHVVPVEHMYGHGSQFGRSP